MSEHERYSPTDNVIQFIRCLIAFCHKNPDRLLEARAFSDRRYSTRGIRKSKAIKLCEHRSIPDHTKRSRASASKEFDYDGAKLRLGFVPVGDMSSEKVLAVRATGTDDVESGTGAAHAQGAGRETVRIPATRCDTGSSAHEVCQIVPEPVTLPVLALGMLMVWRRR